MHRLQIAYSLFADKGRGNQELLGEVSWIDLVLPPIRTLVSVSARNMLQALQFDTRNVPLVSLAEMGRSDTGCSDPYAGFHIAWAYFRAGKCQEALALARQTRPARVPR